jgi:signal transduction histidine kinase
VIGYSDLLLLGVKGSIDDSAREYIDRIRTSATHLLMLIEEILTYSRVEAGREQLHLGPMEVGELMIAVSNLVEPLAIEKRIGFSCEDEGVEHTVLESDAGKLRQILLNLLSNAIKFTDDGGVRLVASEAGDWVEFRVTDTGGGIPEEHLERIFEPFWQAEQSRTRRAEGTGLGLSVARRLTHLLGGDLLVSSRPGHGSTFTVRVPRRLPRAVVENA